MSSFPMFLYTWNMFRSLLDIPYLCICESTLVLCSNIRETKSPYFVSVILHIFMHLFMCHLLIDHCAFSFNVLILAKQKKKWQHINALHYISSIKRQHKKMEWQKLLGKQHQQRMTNKKARAIHHQIKLHWNFSQKAKFAAYFLSMVNSLYILVENLVTLTRQLIVLW